MKIRKHVILDCVDHTYLPERTSKLVVVARGAPSNNHPLSKLTIHHQYMHMNTLATDFKQLEHDLCTFCRP